MATAAAFRQALVRLRFSTEAARIITDEQDYDSVESLKELDDNAVSNLCKIVRRPGGVIVNPAATPPNNPTAAQIATAAAQPSHISNPGVVVSNRAEDNLKLACYFLRHQERISRTVTPADIQMPALKRLARFREAEMSQKDGEPPAINDRDWPETIENIEAWLKTCYGATKIPLAYVIREDIEPGTDPETAFSTKHDEMIRRAPIRSGGTTANPVYADTYLEDRAKVGLYCLS